MFDVAGDGGVCGCLVEGCFVLLLLLLLLVIVGLEFGFWPLLLSGGLLFFRGGEFVGKWGVS
ncbi:hypothetical protein GO611_23730 [Azoarcus communis SWub3 = DSM 12120]|nr:hypothetical protein [Parazoarcus communis SWub3 = DSM 12120]